MPDKEITNCAGWGWEVGTDFTSIRTQAGKIGALKAEKLCSSLNAEQFTQILLKN
jgi:hypothetical protein